jgi:DNA-binding NarL/FixJ family response regulator
MSVILYIIVRKCTIIDHIMKVLHQQLDSNTRLKYTTPIRLLIVDDRAPAREGLRALLSVIGEPYQDSDCLPIVIVGEACDGAQALNMVEEQCPDVVLMDVRMPGLSGLEAARIMKANWPDIHIILLSFYGVHRVEAFNVGADSFLLKGCPPDELIKAILFSRSVSEARGSNGYNAELKKVDGG